MTGKYKPVKNPMTLTERAKKGRAASPWNRGPNCTGLQALRSFREAKRKTPA